MGMETNGMTHTYHFQNTPALCSAQDGLAARMNQNCVLKMVHLVKNFEKMHLKMGQDYNKNKNS